MSPADWERVKAAFAVLRPLTGAPGPESRPAEESRVDRLGLPGELAAEVEALLRADAAAGAFLSRPAGALRSASGEAVPPAESPRLPAQIGPYRVLRRLGRGGMGEVYLAASDTDAFQRRVAVKVIADDGAAPDPALLRRFTTERQVLGALSHPNIARLLGSGVWASPVGERPYLAMEYVDGVPIDVYCQRRRLSVDARLRVFQTVCAALHHAHERLVLHRDLKPSNILVTQDGVPKLLDFGIARPLHPALLPADETATRGGAPCTLEYASPEQVRGEALGPASDVYSLGVLLFRLLSDARPYGVGRGPVDRETVCGREVGQPSEAAPPSRRAALRGDVDRVVEVATSKDPLGRYASAWALWEDLERHRRGQPLLVRPASVGYVTRRFVGRHRGAVTAVALSVLLGAAATLAGVRGERRHREAAARQESELRRLRAALREAQVARPELVPARPEASAAADGQSAGAEAAAGAPWDPRAICRRGPRQALVIRRTPRGPVEVNLDALRPAPDQPLFVQPTVAGPVPVVPTAEQPVEVLAPMVVRLTPGGLEVVKPMLVRPCP